MEPEIRLIHWYDTKEHRIACGAPGQSNSTKHRRAVTCTGCLACIANDRGTANVTELASRWVQ